MPITQIQDFYAFILLEEGLLQSLRIMEIYCGASPDLDQWLLVLEMGWNIQFGCIDLRVLDSVVLLA